MTRHRIVPVAATCAALLLAWPLWQAAGWLTELVGLAGFGLLPKATFMILALGLAARQLDPLAASPGDDRHD
jgi:hypothetical protein